MIDRMDIQRCCFMFVDFQRDFCFPDGYLAHGCPDTGWVDGILPNAVRLLTFARSLGAFVAHSREGYAPDLSDVSPAKLRHSARHGARIGDVGPMGRYLIRGEVGHGFIDAMQPVAGELVIDKSRYGPFCGTVLEPELRRRGVAVLILAGVTADVCVHSTMREAVDRGFECVYVRDAISTPDPQLRLACERMVGQEGGIWGDLATVDEVRALFV